MVVGGTRQSFAGSGEITETEILRTCNEAQQARKDIMLGTMPGTRRQRGQRKLDG